MRRLAFAKTSLNGARRNEDQGSNGSRGGIAASVEHGGSANLRIAGFGVAPIWEALANPGLKDKPMYLSARHEEIAVGMASGYAKSTGKLPAVMVHTSVGSLHASMALRGALHENVPMVVLTGESIAFGESPGPDLGAHWLSQLADIGGPARLVERCVKWSFAVNTQAVFPSAVQRACQLAMTDPKGPVFVSLPLEFLFGEVIIDPPAQAAIP